MDEKQFSEKYPTLAPTLMGYFDMSDISDEEIAEQAVEYAGFSPEKRAAAIRDLIADCNRLCLNLDNEWPMFREAANRHLDSPELAKKWLVRVMGVWERALSKLDGKRPS